jgi:hypothetical protein
MIIFLGLNSFKTLLVNLLPKEPVPPVIKIVLSLNIISKSSLELFILYVLSEK